MTEQQEKYHLTEDDKLVNGMAYLSQGIIWGSLFTKKVIRASLWLKMPMAPEHFHFIDAKMLLFSGSQPARLSFEDILVPTASIIAFHVLPPAEADLDYEPNEVNRRFIPVTVLTGSYHMEGNRRISQLGNLASSLSTSSEKFAALYDATITYLNAPTMRQIKVPIVVVRQEAAIYSQTAPV